MNIFKKIEHHVEVSGFWEAVLMFLKRFPFIRHSVTFANLVVRKRTHHNTNNSLFPDVDVRRVLLDVKKNALYLGMDLSGELVEEIQRFAEESECVVVAGGKRHSYRYKERINTERLIGYRLPLARYADLAACPAIRRIQEDPKLLEISTRYLLGDPHRVNAIMWWSFPIEATDEERLAANQTVRFHYDLESFRFIYFNFYLTDVDLDSGPHVIVLGSHRKKKLSHFFSSVNRSDEDIQRFYGRSKIIEITGKSGMGFVEDSYCYHKACIPLKKSRLMLQIRVT